MRVSLFSLLIIAITTVHAAEPRAPGRVVFNRDVRPILAENCLSCHGPDASHRKADLRLDLREEAIAMKAIVAGQPDQSGLIHRILEQDADVMMPPPSSKKQLTAQQKETLRQWILEGAEYQKHWAFEAPQKAIPPDVKGIEHPVDRFLQARLAEDGLTASPLATPETLIRRVSLDLTGLPPSVSEVDSFLKDTAVDADAAYRQLVDRLLMSPHYGERWGRWWLDQARYADSNGYSIDAPRQIWAWRDWVIDALNAGMPFDEFTIQQLAGDLLPDASESQKIATGFHRNTQINQEGGIDREQFRIDSVFDRVATTGTVWLGLTIGCAQCHDHKFDPITQKEYYQLFAFLNNQDEPSLRVYGRTIDPVALKARMKELEKEISERISQRASSLAEWEKGLTEEHKKQLSAAVTAALAITEDKRTIAQKRTIYAAYVAGAGAADTDFAQKDSEYADIEKTLNGAPTTLVMQELAQPRRTTVFIKGDFTRPADEVTPGTPALLHPLENTTGKASRLDLARWLVSRQNPLSARVFVNRVWQQYFGPGIVETENDFGAQGTLPSHPELLDYLAVEFMDRGWQMKDLHRLIVTSHAYRQASVERADLLQKDPHNILLGRQRRLRLDAEIIRDVALSASGLLSHKLGGPPVFPPIPDGVLSQGQVKQAWNVSTGEDRYRRGLYTFVFRASPPPAMNVFDAPDGYSTCTRRIRSNTPLQALTLLNDTTSVEFAAAMEKLVREEGLEAAFRRCTSRFPQPDELAVLQSLDVRSAARVLLNLDETITRE